MKKITQPRFTIEPAPHGVLFKDRLTDAAVTYNKASDTWTITVPQTGTDFAVAVDIITDFQPFIERFETTIKHSLV